MAARPTTTTAIDSMRELTTEHLIIRGQIIDACSVDTLHASFPDEPLMQELADFLEDWFSACPNMLLSSSGSTGEPKQFYASKQAMRNSARASCQALHLRAGNHVLLALPLIYIAAKMMIVRAIVAGLHLELRKPSSRPLEGSSELYDFAPLVPLQAAKSSDSELSQLRSILLGGGFIPSELERRLQHIPTSIYASYGMTETLSHIALRRVNGETRSDYYQPLDGIVLSLNEQQCLCIHAPALDIQYLESQDRAELRADGSFRILGRVDSLIKSGGVKLQAEDIEERITSATGLSVIALPAPHPQLGECVALLWEGLLSEQPALQAAIEGKLAPYQAPKICLHLPDGLPRGASGKVARAQAREYLLASLAESNR